MRTIPSIVLVAAMFAATGCGPSNSDKLDDHELASAEGSARAGGGAADDTRCTARAAHDEVKRQLFARAAEIRGANADNYARIAEFAVLQIDGAAPVAAASGSLADCRGQSTLRLPTGLKVAGGRTTLTGDVSFSVAAGARGMVTLGQSDAIAIPLATLTQNRAPAPRPAPAPVRDTIDPLAPSPQAAPAPAPVPVQQPAPPPEVNMSARPSFDCRRARTSGERAVCDSPALAALDRSMAAQYRSAAANGGPDERRLLVQTRDRFLGFRDRCGTEACIANAYRGRMREIDDIVAGRWRGNR